MAALLDKFKSRKSRVTEKKEAKCTCGEELMTISGEKKDLYFCSACNRLLYFLESEMEVPKIIPFSLGWLKKK
ncbi:hypothetical protein ACOBQJ_07350 [Pelotomaculum propionicicum]|uniref:hypothetical protein n=1 Tax=Pelotomaculum propionicicum TaxID=258475 RepID=UPI003B774B22